ncbi:hypothetical protein [Vibrio rumoiensis]|uniref:Outer membrane protein beta-barrel domain-containing protein n=1 Tax=Vibrio rumoiensis 1S-45 TaxID=1188252 RepID=A0A1E5E675_9VIBR|nr:hypothetical protein [Vibrio rumoiensis]OEF30004.1 hypothetical protein A1QC_03170 [Vibrio rumoiensis 1S-45]
MNTIHAFYRLLPVRITQVVITCLMASMIFSNLTMAAEDTSETQAEPASVRAYDLPTDQPSEAVGIHSYSSSIDGDDDRSEAQKKNDQIWDHVLPFGAQVAIYNGYDLPLPFGVSLIYSKTKQNQLISNLNVGHNGNANVNVDSIASFDRFETDTIAPQIKIDAWILPFLNVFGVVGHSSGTADLNVDISGDGLLNGLSDSGLGPKLIGTANDYCKSLPPAKRATCYGAVQGGKAIVKNKLAGTSYDLGVTADVGGYNYTIGTMLAGGVHNWFYVMPMSYTKNEMASTNVGGGVVNIQPRMGYNFHFSNGNNLALYTGASYMDINQTISGGYTPGEGAGKDEAGPKTLNFSVDQENEDKWAGIMGVNLSLNKSLSLAMEHTGYKSDSRKQTLVLLNGRF